MRFVRERLRARTGGKVEGTGKDTRIQESGEVGKGSDAD